MITLKKDAVHRIVATEEEAKALISQGYVQLDEEGNPVTAATSEIESLKAQVAQLTAENEALKSKKQGGINPPPS